MKSPHVYHACSVTELTVVGGGGGKQPKIHIFSSFYYGGDVGKEHLTIWSWFSFLLPVPDIQCLMPVFFVCILEVIDPALVTFCLCAVHNCTWIK